MMYIAKVVCYNDLTEKQEKIACFVPGDSYSDALDTMISYYAGTHEEAIASITLELWSPNNFLAFDMESAEQKGTYEVIREIFDDSFIW